ncbi:MAG TPA: GNAT family N-acetyltransferase [Acidimicrobiales bacterium]|jgi:GNAT superfamily N-acetyltransferase|nr:GNAT family N-acetyltransferase [Acidimicrobiales bacterium]
MADIVVLGRERAGSAAEALAASHAGYPAFRHVFPHPRRRQRALRAFFAATVADAVPFGAVFGAVDGPAVLGVAAWLPPGAFPWSAGRKARATPAFLRVFLADPRAFRTFARVGANAERAHPAEPHWFLEVLGIRPGAQRQGLGTRLMAPALEQADGSGMPCALETSDPANVAYYRRFGFEVVDESLALVPGGPTHVAMRRPPGG